MNNPRRSLSSAALAAALIVLATTGVCAAATPASTSTSTSPVFAQARPDMSANVQLAHEDEGDPHEMHPHCDMARSHRHTSYNDEYIFGLTRGIADTTMHPAVKILVFPITVPLDFALLPFEVIGGLF